MSEKIQRILEEISELTPWEWRLFHIEYSKKFAEPLARRLAGMEEPCQE